MKNLWLGLAAVGAVAGCGLISSDVTRIDFNLPEQTYTLNTAMWNLPAGSTQAVPCGPDQMVMDCCNPPPPLPTPDCTATPLICAVDPSSSSSQTVCTAALPESVSSEVNLSSAFTNPASSVLKDVQIAKITYAASNNTLSVPLPALTIYLAPMGVTDPTDARAMMFGTIPSIPAATDTSGNVELVPNANSIFQTYAANLSTPFEIIAAGTVDIPSGESTPTGEVTLTIDGQLSTQF